MCRRLVSDPFLLSSLHHGLSSALDLVHAVRGFSRISTPALLLTVLTGAVQTWRLDRGALFDSSHGRVLLVKALAVGVMVFVGLATRQFVSTRLRKADSMTGPMASRLRRG